MRTTLSALLLSTACVFAFALPATGATIVIGVNDAAQECYRAAKAEDPRGLPVCNSALTQQLTARDRAATLINRGAIRFAAHDYQGGLTDSEASIKTYDRLGEAYLNRGAALRELGQPGEAIEAFNKSIEIGFGRLPLAYFDRGMAKEDMGDVKGAYRDYKKALELSPDFQHAAEQLKRFRVTSGA